MKREGIGIRLTAFIAVYHLQGLDSDFCMNQIFWSGGTSNADNSRTAHSWTL